MGKIISKVTKPIAKVLDKIVPNEIKPILPYLAAIAPFTAPFGTMAGGLTSLGINNPMIQRAVLGGGLNLLSQASQEGAAERGINPLSVALAAGTGYLSSPGATEALQGAQTVGTSTAGNLSAADLASKFPGIDSASQLGYSTDLSFLDQAKNLGLEGLSKIAGPLEKATSADLFSMDFLKGAGTPLGMAATEQAYNAALDAQREYEKELADYTARTGQALADSNATRIKAITSSMTNAGFGTSDIESALRQIGLLSVGGRVGYEEGGGVADKGSKSKKNVRASFEIMSSDGTPTGKYSISPVMARSFSMSPRDPRENILPGRIPGYRNGGRMGYADAGIVSLTDEDSGVIYRDENEKPISKEKAMELFNQQAEEESNSRPLDREDILQFYSDAQTTSKLLDKVLKDKKFNPNDYRRLERIRNEYVDRKYDLDPTNYPDKKELMDAEKYFDKFNVDTRGVDTQLNDVMMDQGSKEFGKLYNYGKVKYNSPEGIQIVADKLGIPFEKAKDIKDVFEKSKTKFEYNLEDLDIKRITPKVVIMNKNGETQIMDEDLAKKLNANIIMNSFDTEQILRQENKANGGIIGLMGGGMPSMEMDYRGGGFIPIGAKERADDVPARLSKNEFVMTADAVRAAGGGSVNEGARRMYQLMNALEGRTV